VKKKLLGLYSLKYNPFSPEVPTEALYPSGAIESFCWRIEHQIGEGGFAMISGDPGTGKSATLRILTDRLDRIREVKVGLLSRPQASVADFYREMGALFGVGLSPHNRWNGAKLLREKWQTHIEASLSRPVLIIDEAQETLTTVLSELRLLSSTALDSRSILSVILAGDQRLSQRLQEPELLPIASRIRSRLRTEAASSKQLRESLTHLLEHAGNPNLIDSIVLDALCEHAVGTYRVLMNMANDLLVLAVRREAPHIDQQLFFEAFTLEPPPGGSTKKHRKTKR
jgi:general secretion pathway protein A